MVPPAKPQTPMPRASSFGVTTAVPSVAPTAVAPAPAVSPCGALPTGREVLTEAAGAIVFTTDGTSLFWSDGHAIWRRAISGGTPSRIVDDAVSVSQVRALAVDGDQVWFSSAKWVGSACLGAVGFVGLEGGKVQRVGPTGCIDGLALTKDQVVFVTERSIDGIVGTVHVAARAAGTKSKILVRDFNGSGGVVTDGAYAYFPGEIGQLQRVALGGGKPEKLAGRERGIDDVTGTRFALDEENVYFYHGHLNLDGLRIRKMPKAGGAMTELADALPKTPQGSDYPRGPLALSKEHVYWSHPGSGVVKRVKKDGKCAPDTIATGENGPDHVTVIGDHVYWLEATATPPRVVRMKLAP